MSTQHRRLSLHDINSNNSDAYAASQRHRHPHRMRTWLSLHGINNIDSDVYAASQPTVTSALDAYAAQPTRHQQSVEQCLRGITAYSDVRIGRLRGSAYTARTTWNNVYAASQPTATPKLASTRLSLNDMYTCNEHLSDFKC